jgi:hypothetical protein
MENRTNNSTQKQIDIIVKSAIAINNAEWAEVVSKTKAHIIKKTEQFFLDYDIVKYGDNIPAGYTDCWIAFKSTMGVSNEK